jgi:hypothetical protein
MNDWGDILRGFRFGFVRGAVAVVFVTTLLIWILEATEHDSPFHPVSGRHSGLAGQHPYTRSATQAPRAEGLTVQLIHPDGTVTNAGDEASEKPSAEPRPRRAKGSGHSADTAGKDA